MRLHAKISSSFDSQGLIEHEVLTGATFASTYNEELDSGTIVITHLQSRLNINPYDWVRVYSEAYQENGQTKRDFDKLYLVDNYVERQINILQPYYEYTIELMSETKLLEKIQLPNRQWQHSFNADGTESRKTIYEIIHEVCEAYIPKIKVRSSTDQRGFAYEPLITESAGLETKFDFPARDISLSQPTFRQCLTALMTQVGCIPMVKDGELTYLDLRAKPTEMTLNPESFNQVQRSASSDSFVNQIVNQGENILDADNRTVSETVGFRDRNKVFLKQTENLYLETRYPIYKVTKLRMAAWMKAKIKVMNHAFDTGAMLYGITYSQGDFTITTQFTSAATILKRVIAWGVYGNAYNTGAWAVQSTDTRGQQSVQSGYFDDVWTRPQSATSFVYAIQYRIGSGTPRWIYAMEWIYGHNYEFWLPYGNDKTAILFKHDITPLCVEQTKRQLLDTDFKKMTQTYITGLDRLAEFYYGTVGYQIGGKTIEGWSDTYTMLYASEADWWDIATVGDTTVTKTYIENITEKLLNEIKDAETINSRIVQGWLFGDIDDEIIQTIDWEITDADTLGRDDHEGDKISNFTDWFFDIEYQPLNSLNVKYSKGREIPIPYEQLDSPDSAISSMDALSLNERDTVERLGNPVMSINQYAADEYFSQIKRFDGAPLEYQNHTVFQIVYSFDFNGTAANYFASEGYVIKNYQTAIMTKYRAYQYINYSQAITRKENEKVYVLLSKTKYYDMDDRITFGTLTGGYYESDSKKGLLSPFGATANPLEIGYQYKSPNAYKNEMSVLTYGSSVILNQEEFDNASAGLHLLSETEYNDIGGGVPQAWYMWPDSAHETRSVGWMESISKVYEADDINPTQQSLDAALGIIAEMPKISDFTQLPNGTDSHYETFQIISLKNKEYDKDYGELLNQSLQFEYYSDDGSIRLGAYFADAVSWKGRDGWRLGVIIKQNAYRELSETEYEIDPSAVGPISDHISYDATEMSFEATHWPTYPEIIEGQGYLRYIHGSDNHAVIKVVMHKTTDDGTFARDCYEIDAGSEIPQAISILRHPYRYYVRLNDTKTQKVFEIDEDTHIPYLKYEANHL